MEAERKISGARILVVPYPSQGHVNPMLQFCKRLLSKGAKPTLVLTNFISKSFSLHSTSIAVATISDGFDHGGFRQAKDVDDYLARMQIAGSRTLTDLVRSREESGDRVDCIVYDAFLTWALDVAHGCGIKGAAFFTHACAVNYVYYYAACGALKLPVEAAPVVLPGLPPLDLPDFPSFIYVHGSYPAYFKMVLNEFSNLDRADFVLVNTFYKLEEEEKMCMVDIYPQEYYFYNNTWNKWNKERDKLFLKSIHESVGSVDGREELLVDNAISLARFELNSSEGLTLEMDDVRSRFRFLRERYEAWTLFLSDPDSYWDADLGRWCAWDDRIWLRLFQQNPMTKAYYCAGEPHYKWLARVFGPKPKPSAQRRLFVEAEST